MDELFSLLVKWIKPKSSKELSGQVNEKPVVKTDIDFPELRGINTDIGMKCCKEKKSL